MSVCRKCGPNKNETNYTNLFRRGTRQRAELADKSIVVNVVGHSSGRWGGLVMTEGVDLDDRRCK
jgi:hypothetical protein